MIHPIPGFQHFPTHHCITGSLRHLYEFHGFPISEEMLLGLGAGVGFVYWHTRGSLPFLGGRANFARPGIEGLEKTTGRRTGLTVNSIQTSSPARAEQGLLQQLDSGRPVMVMVDMGFLPYFDFGGQEYHFGGHAVVVCGYNAETREVLIADREVELHPVDLETLALARGSTWQPFPPHHTWFDLDFSGKRSPTPEELRQAIGECAQGMLHPPITNLGVKGIRKAAQRIRQWPEIMDDQALRAALFNAGIMIDARTGTGGGLFRYMYARFLQETSALLPPGLGLEETAARFQSVGDCWQEVSAILVEASTAPEPSPAIQKACQELVGIAEQEEAAWSTLQHI